MGNQPCTQYGGMMINFDKPYYYPGDVVTGNVYMNVLEAFESRGLELSLKIKEYVKWEDVEYHTETRREYDEVTKEHRDVPHTVSKKVERKDHKTLFKNSYLKSLLDFY